MRELLGYNFADITCHKQVRAYAEWRDRDGRFFVLRADCWRGRGLCMAHRARFPAGQKELTGSALCRGFRGIGGPAGAASLERGRRAPDTIRGRGVYP